MKIKPNHHRVSHSPTKPSFVMEFHTNYHMNTMKDIRLLPDGSEYFDEDEDGVFYDELRRQILQLTEEDDDDSASAAEYSYKIEKNPNVGFAAQQHTEYYNWKDHEAPAWILKLWRSGNVNGTGVFIPQVVSKPRNRRNRNRKKKNQRDRTNKTVE